MRICIHNTDAAIEIHEDSENEAENGQNVLADINPENVEIGVVSIEFAEELVRRWNLCEPNIDDADAVPKHIEFTITLSGTGDDVDACWIDAVDAFAIDPGTPPDKQTEIVE